MDDCISRKGVSAWLDNMGYSNLAEKVMDEKRFPSVKPDGKETTMKTGGKLGTNVLCVENHFLTLELSVRTVAQR